MDKIKIKDLAVHIREFAEALAPQMLTVISDENGKTTQLDDDGEVLPVFLEVEDMLAVWLQLPDCSYTHMFCGWMIARGLDLDQYTPADVDKAVCIALTGSEKNVMSLMFDWDGDLDAKKKLN